MNASSDNHVISDFIIKSTDLFADYVRSQSRVMSMLNRMAEQDEDGPIAKALKEASAMARTSLSPALTVSDEDWAAQTPEFGPEPSDPKVGAPEYILGMFDCGAQLQAIEMNRDHYITVKSALNALCHERGTYTPDLQFVASILFANSRGTLTPEYATRLLEEFKDATAHPPALDDSARK